VSFRVLVIPEDPTHNGYILKPLVQALLADIGKPKARVEVLGNPRLEGYDHAMRAIKSELSDRYQYFDLWLFFPDADRANPIAMQALEQQVSAKGIPLFCCPALPEVEIYACAGWRDKLGRPWAEVQGDTRMKENIFEPLLRQYGDSRRAGGGRDLLIAESLRNLTLLLSLCPELKELRERLKIHLETPSQ
jgi:hypothetical protein